MQMLHFYYYTTVFISVFILNIELVCSQTPLQESKLYNAGEPFGHYHHIIQEKPDLTLYYTTHCPYSRKVLRYLQEIHRTIPMKNVEKNPQSKGELLKMGGILQVPCLIVNEEAIYYADPIIDWLSAHQGLLDPLEN